MHQDIHDLIHHKAKKKNNKKEKNVQRGKTLESNLRSLFTRGHLMFDDAVELQM